MKKTLRSIIVVLFIVSMLFSLSGCANEESNKEAEEFSLGEWNNDVYTNSFLGLSFKLPDGWAKYTQEEIIDMMNLGQELLNDDQKIASQVSQLNTAYYMVASDPSTGNNVSVMSEKPAMDVTTEYYINQVKTQLTRLESIRYEVEDESKEKIGDREYSTLTVKANVYGYTLTQRYYTYKKDKYFISIIATSNTGEEAIDEMIKNFK